MVASNRVEQTCEACKAAEVFRKGYGCDEPFKNPDGTTKVQVEIDCPSCQGIPGGCGYCDFEGKIKFDRCPRQLVRESQGTIKMLNFYTTCFSPHGHLPGPGGMLDQPAAVVASMQHLSHVQNELAKKK